MTVQSIWWPGITGRDLHLLPGLVSPRLDHLLAIGDSITGSHRADAPPLGVTVAFALQLAISPASVGFTFNPATGEIEILAQLPAPTPAMPRIRSFVVDATVTDPKVTSPFTASIRVLVHERLSKLWLTPPSLTVRKGASNLRFTVLARFDDGTIGDVTNWAPFEPLSPNRPGDRTYVHAAGSAAPELFWSPVTTSGPVGVDSDTGVLHAGADTGGNKVNVTPRSFPASGADATAQCDQEWATPTPLDPVAGPGFAAMGDDDVRNILFLPDGFADTKEDRDAFKRFVRIVVGRLSTRRRTRPWDLLNGQLNYFTAFVPSPQTGVSVLHEVDPGAPPSEALPMEQPTRPDPAATAWTLEELLYKVGPPTPFYDPPGTLLAAEVSAWNMLYGSPVPVTSGLVAGAYPDWLKRGDRVLLNERNSAFHTAAGHRPGLTGTGTDRDLAFHPLRTDVSDFEAFLGALEDDMHTKVGGTWARNGKDDDLVVIVCRTTRNGGSNNLRGFVPADGHYMCVSLSDELAHELEPARRGDGFDVRVRAVPSQVIADTWTTIAHELAHSLSLADEYGEQPGPVNIDTSNDVAKRANAQLRSLLLGAGGIETALLKWAQWPRLARAGVLAGNPVAVSGGNFTVTLRPGHAAAFRDHDIVRLRTRPLVDAAGHSDQLTVVGDPAGDTLTLMPRVGSRLTPARYPAGSIVMVPLRAPDQGTVLGDDLMLAARSILDRIDATHNPLNALGSEPVNRPCPGPAARPTLAQNFLNNEAPKPPRFSSWIVGVYEGGAQYACDVFRPAGVCIMRDFVYRPKPALPERAAEFCPVCRYAMVDLLDPTKHGRIDRDYAPRYPK